MSKESRRRQRMAGQAPGSVPGAAPTGRGASSGRPAEGQPATARPSSSPRGTERAGRRERTRPLTRGSFIQRYRTWIVAGAVAAVIAVVGAAVFAAATQTAYACSQIWQPSATASPGPSASAAQLGYVQPDMGHAHVPVNTVIRYTYCPPASGKHYDAPEQGPIPARAYGPNDGVIPEGWIHNLEHGGLVILYRGADADQAALQAVYSAIPPSPVCGFPPGGNSPGPVIARFDQMAWPYAAVVWDHVLPMETLDKAAVLEFYARYGERDNPQKFCAPSPSPEPSTSPESSASPSPTATPAASSSAPSGSASPAASPS